MRRHNEMTAHRTRFIGVPLTLDTQDIYLPKHCIENALRNAMSLFQGRFLDVGCGEKPYHHILMVNGGGITEYIGIDLDPEITGASAGTCPDIFWDGIKIPLADASVDSAMATEVLEHCPDPACVLAEVHRVLRGNGTFFMTVPFLWPLHNVPYDEYRYTPYSLKRLLENAGFVDVEVRPLGGWNASLAQMIGLYVQRAPMGNIKRRILRRVAFPIVRYLIKNDRLPDLKTDTMITALSATAHKR